MIADWIGSSAAVSTTVSFAPQVIKTLRTGNTRGISLGMYAMFCAGVALWCLYGLLIEAWPVVIANTLTFVLASIVLWHKLRETQREERRRHPSPETPIPAPAAPRDSTSGRPAGPILRPES